MCSDINTSITCDYINNICTAGYLNFHNLYYVVKSHVNKETNH